MQGMGDWLNSRRHFSAGLLPLITAVSLLLIFPAVTLGAALTWVGTGADADFMTAGNWSPAQQPTTSDSCTINSTSNLQPSILTNATCGSLTLGTGASLMTLSFTAAKNFDITGDVTIGSNGRLAASGGLYNGVITVGGNWTDPAGTTNLLTANMQPLFIFIGSGKTLASNETFYQLRVNGGSITLGGNITITDFLDITNGSTLTHGNYTITHNGTSFTNGGTYNFTCGSTLSLYGTISLNNDYHYPNVVINSGAIVTGGNTAFVDCDLTIQSGSTFTTATSLEVGGNWINNGGTIDFGSGTVTMTGSGKQIAGTTPTTFHNLVIGNGAGDSITSTLNLTVTNDFTVFAGASFTQTAGRNVTVNGRSTVDGNVYLSGTTTWYQKGPNQGITVGANGLLSALGTDTSNRVTITSPDGSFYNLIINGGIDFNNVNLWYTNTTSTANSGFRLLSPITATVNFNNVAINYVNDIGSGSVMMLLNTPGGRVINSSGCTFDSSTFDVGSDINVEATAGTIVFTPYSGNWSGEALDNDNGGTVTWGDRINLVSGRVFEDANFSGTAAGWDGGASDKAMANVDVELYNNANAYISSTTTAADGTYSFANILDGTYKIRVRSATAGDANTIPQGGFNACVPGTCAYPIPTMTWGNSAALYGGQSATADDTATGDNAGPGNTYISLTLADADVANVDFGFAYNLIVSTDDDSNNATTRSKAGTLRQFIKNANAIGAAGGTTANYSQFRMQVATNQSSGSDAWWRITPGIALPTLSDSSTTIDGTTQTTNQGNTNTLGPEIEINGTAAPAASNALTITGGTATIRGLIIDSFTGYGIDMSSTGSNTIAGNYVGLNATGTSAPTALFDCLRVNGTTNNTIGGTTAADRNVIGGCLHSGVYITGAGATGNVVKGNYIGTNAAGTAAIANESGVGINAGTGNTIGGTAAGSGNIISGSIMYGIAIYGNSNTVVGNYIGTNAGGTAAVGNQYGVLISGATNNTIGGTTAGERNIISGNTGAGVYLTTNAATNSIFGNYIGTTADGAGSLGNRIGVFVANSANNNAIGGTGSGQGNVIANSTGGGASSSGVYLTNAGTIANIISGNSIFSNGGLGIDILPVGIGTGSGANNNKARPVITTVVPSGANFTITATATGGDTVEFFRVNNAAAPAVTPDGSGSGEGYLYLGKCVDNGACSGPHISAVADANAAAGTIQAMLLASGLVIGDSVSATATDAVNGTSEFSANVLVTGLADLSVTKTDNPDPAPAGGELLYTLLITNNGPGNATGVTVTDNLPASVTFVSATPSQGSCSGTTTVTCNLGSILNTGTASVEILVVTSGSGSITNNASVTVNEPDPVPGNNSASINTQVVVGGTTDIPLTQYRRIHGFIDYAVTGGSLRTASNSVNPCTVGASSSAALSGIPAGATIVNAYLYWAGSGSTVDSQITLDGTSFTADRTWQAQYVLSGTTYDFFGGFKDVTAQVQAKRNGNYTFSGLSAATGNPYCSLQAVLAGWSMIVIYQDSSLSGKTLVLYDGLDIARNGSTAYTLAGIYATAPPEGKATYLTWEGDSTLSGTDEKLVFNGTTLSDGLNPSNNVYNSTINNLGVNNSYGVDLDTFNVSATINARDSLASTTVSVGPDLVILNAVVLQVTSNVIVGKIFEDVNYGGGAGRDLATAVAGAPGFTVPRPNATVELYDAGGSLIRTTSTAANGEYGFTGLPDGNYTVRVVNSTVTSSRAGYVAGLWPVQTFRTDASTGTTVSVTNEVGGAVPANQDSGANVTSANLGSFFSQSKAPVQIITGIAATSVDFGFNFNTVVNKNDTGQGSLRQFISNANTLSNASLAQSGRTAGLDNAIFMLADGTGRPGLKAGYPSMFASGIATIGPASALPDITSPAILDAATQPGYGGTPMIEINGNGAGAGSNGFRITAGGSSLRGFIINRFGQSGIELSGSSGSTVQACYLGTDASGAAGSPNGRGILIANSSNNTIGGSAAGTGNLIAYNSGPGVSVTGGTGNLISRNSIYANTGLGIDLSADGVTMNDNGDADTGPNDLFNYPILTTAVISGSNIVLSGYARPGSIVEVFVAEADPTGFGEGKTYLFTATEGGGSDGDAGTGNYGPGAINGLSQGTDTTNRFIITVPLPGGVVAGTILTATATDGSNNTSEFSGKVTVQSSQYRPDAMIKLSTEGDPTYLTDNTYEGTAIVQIKSLGVLSGSTAAYTVKFQNDGNLSDTLVITGTGSGSGFTVQYLDETAADRTAAVTGAGYSINGLAVGGSKVWTLNITPAGNPTPVVGGTSYNVIVTATSSGDGTKTDQLKAITTSTSATLTFLKSANKATYNPGEDIAYTMTATNMAGLTDASNVVISDPIPANTGFKIAGATFNAGTSTLTATISYSNNNGATWVYTPVSGGCAAPAGYDYCATNVRWTMSGNMPQGTNFSSGLVVRVK